MFLASASLVGYSRLALDGAHPCAGCGPGYSQPADVLAIPMLWPST
jgi:hypothetical protein